MKSINHLIFKHSQVNSRHIHCIKKVTWKCQCQNNPTTKKAVCSNNRKKQLDGHNYILQKQKINTSIWQRQVYSRHTHSTKEVVAQEREARPVGQHNHPEVWVGPDQRGRVWQAWAGCGWEVGQREVLKFMELVGWKVKVTNLYTILKSQHVEFKNQGYCNKENNLSAKY